MVGKISEDTAASVATGAVMAGVQSGINVKVPASLFADVATYDPQGVADDAFDRANHTGSQAHTTITGLGTAAVASVGDFATAAQGALAATAVQPGDLGTAAAADTGDFATAAQGLLAASALQPAAAAALYQDKTEHIVVACSDETTALTTGTAKVTFRMPYAMTVTSVKASLSTAQTSGSILTVDINDSGTTILSTKLTIDNGEKTSTTAVTAAVVSDTALASDAEVTIDIDQVGDGTAKGLKVTLIGTRS